MSVYTSVGREALADWLHPLQVGAYLGHAGISAGMQNSNYFVETSAGRWVLTLFEHLPEGEVAVYLRLMQRLAERGIACPRPCPDPAGRLVRPLAGKPAALFNCLPGRDLETPDLAACREIGRVLARLHLAAADLDDFPANPCGAAWRQQVGEELLPLLPPAERELLADELAFQQQQGWTVDVGDGLPAGVIHGDLFRDNVLWDAAGQVGGLLDFYFAGVDAWLYDLAIVVNDWCSDAERTQALVSAYATERPFTDRERACWPAVRRAAALRFWLLRLDACYRPRPGEDVLRKDPAYFGNLLQALRQPGAAAALLD